MSTKIGIGAALAIPQSPSGYWKWVDLCEEAGIDSIWHSDQLVGQSLEPLAMLWVWMAIRGGLGREFAFQIVKR